jgi:hypothetical protein
MAEEVGNCCASSQVILIEDFGNAKFVIQLLTHKQEDGCDSSVAAASYLLQYSEIGDIFIKYMRNRR